MIQIRKDKLLDCILQILHSGLVVSRFRFFKNTFRLDFSLWCFDHFFVERLQRTSSACGNHKGFDGGYAQVGIGA